MKKIILFTFIATLGACSLFNGSKPEYPKDPDDLHKQRNGTLSANGGMRLFGESDADRYAAGSVISVNAFLWRASLDTISFMPIAAADPVGGTILTDWYENPETPGERFKINILLLDKKLRSDAVKVSVYKQVLDKNKNWRDAKIDGKLALNLEDKILVRARELKIASQKKN